MADTPPAQNAPDPSQTPAQNTPPAAGTPPAQTPPPPDPKADEVPKTWDEIFKHKRFKELTDKASEAEKELADRRKKETEAEEKARLAKGEHEKIIEELKPKAARADELEKIIKSSVDEMLAKIPDDKKTLVPSGMPVEQQFAYLNANWQILTGTPRNIGHPANPGSSSVPGNETFTAEQLNDPVFYAKNAAAIKKAVAEGRITD